MIGDLTYGLIGFLSDGLLRLGDAVQFSLIAVEVKERGVDCLLLRLDITRNSRPISALHHLLNLFVGFLQEAQCRDGGQRRPDLWIERQMRGLAQQREFLAQFENDFFQLRMFQPKNFGVLAVLIQRLGRLLRCFAALARRVGHVLNGILGSSGRCQVRTRFNFDFEISHNLVRCHSQFLKPHFQAVLCVSAVERTEMRERKRQQSMKKLLALLFPWTQSEADNPRKQTNENMGAGVCTVNASPLLPSPDKFQAPC